MFNLEGKLKKCLSNFIGMFAEKVEMASIIAWAQARLSGNTEEVSWDDTQQTRLAAKRGSHFWRNKKPASLVRTPVWFDE